MGVCPFIGSKKGLLLVGVCGGVKSLLGRKGEAVCPFIGGKSGAVCPFIGAKVRLRPCPLIGGKSGSVCL